MATAFSDSTDFWNKRFDTPDYIFGRAPNEYLQTQANRHLNKGDAALCVADGEGRNSVWLAKQGMQVDAFDLSGVALKKAVALAKEEAAAVQFTLASSDSWDWQPNQYDAVVGIFIQFADPVMRLRLFAQMASTLRPGGLLILQGYTPKQLEFKTGGPSILEHLYTEDMIRTLIGDLEPIDLCLYEKELSEGPKHTGMSALLGLVARKPF
ncbi:class I SAM-dependent methyltransferase [Polynucleobacter sp.]|uniref:class I SAM-dependent methyltransferase n=1 Tax=Polynucleobacter sp. TaxID=2029855 RepID=UPI0027375B12|nr:class I SAM-dependent methyltransferase [Polynucleobacter sp.]MDP3122518.1 class I SAM-dependent methyltransferase [Polynucleobacter sp.]